MKLHIFIGLILCLLAGGSVRAGTTLNGQLGLDLELYDFSGKRNESSTNYSVNRTRSNHFLNLALAGPLVDSYFANYSFRTNIFGTYYKAKSDQEETNIYMSPELRTYYGQMTLFPTRPFPLQIYSTRTRDFTLRYEAGNRSNAEIIQPALAVVRRYETDRQSHGGMLQVSFSERISLLTEYRRENSEIARTYDFAENRDIWVNLVNLNINSLNERDTITIMNDLPGDSIRILVDNQIDLKLLPGASGQIIVDSGLHEVDVIPLTLFNQYSFRIDIRGNMIWRVVFNRPAAPNDMDQENAAASFNFKYGGSGPFTSETFYEYSDQYESLTGLQNFLNNFNNNAVYKLSRSSSVQFTTTYNQDKTTIDSISTQINKSLLHSSAFSYSRMQGIVLSLMHTYNRNSSDFGESKLQSEMNSFTGRFSKPFRKLNYLFDARGDMSLLKDNAGYRNNQISVNFNNSIEFVLIGFNLKPRNLIKYTINDKKNPDLKSRELEMKFGTTVEKWNHPILGDIILKAEFGFKNRNDKIGSDNRNKYIFDISFNRRFGKNHRILLYSSHEIENFGGSTPVPGTNADQISVASEGDRKASYKIDVQTTPLAGFTLNGNFMILSQKKADITKVGLSLNLTLPLIHLPVRSFLTMERRDLENLPRQSQINLETKLTYRFRKLSLVLTHGFIEEKLVANTFHYNELNAELMRQF